MVKTNKMPLNRDSKPKSVFIRKAKAGKEKIKTHTQVQISGLRDDSARVKRNHAGTLLRQIGGEMVQDSKART